MLSKIFIVCFKEIKEVLRDRRTLIFMIVMPTVLVPLLMILLVSFVVKSEQKAQTEILSFSIFGSENLPQLAEEFTDNEDFKQVNIASLDDVTTAIKDKKIRFAIVIPENALEHVEKNEQIADQEARLDVGR